MFLCPYAKKGETVRPRVKERIEESRDFRPRAKGGIQWLCVVLVLAFVAGCGDQPAQPPSPQSQPPAPQSQAQPRRSRGAAPAQPEAQPRAPLHFVLAAGGLAEKGKWKGAPLLADVNQDGLLDLVATSRLGDGVHVWLGDGHGGWKDASRGLANSSGCGGGVAVGDINGDGRMDLALADHCQGVSVYLSDGEGGWKATATDLNPAIASRGSNADEDAYNVFRGAEDLALGDVNRDGLLDIVAAASDRGGFTVYYGDGSGLNWREESKPNGLPTAQDPEQGDEQQGGWANRVLLRDLNQDGHLDVVASYYAGPRVWLGDGAGRFRPSSQGLPVPTAGGLFRGIEVGDFNEDGRLDLVVANDANGPEIFLQQSDGTWAGTPDVFPAMTGGAVSVAPADLDRDGHLDLIVAGRKGKDMGSIYGVFALRGDGRGGWTELRG